MKTGSESIEAIMRRRRILFAGSAARMEDTGLPKGVMLGELGGGGAGCVGGQEKGWMGYFFPEKRVGRVRRSPRGGTVGRSPREGHAAV